MRTWVAISAVAALMGIYRGDGYAVPTASGQSRQPDTIAVQAAEGPPAPETTTQTVNTAPASYDPSGRRDPFRPVGSERPPGVENLDLPPLQRVSLTEINVIGIIWGGFGYSAMVQTPDGKGYTVRRGTRIGPNSGMVSAITENALVVQEQFSDVYGKKQIREYVKHLHEKDSAQ